MKLSVIIVNYNVKYYLEQCLYTVMKATHGIKCEIIVFDNHSSDGSIEYLKNRYPIVKFICSYHNVGFAKGNNAAIRQSTGEYILLLNPDTFVGEDVLKNAIEFMDSNPKVGGVGVRMRTSNGQMAPESRRAIPTIITSFLKMIGKDKRYYMRHLPIDKPCRIEVISGAFCMLRRKALEEIGLLDPSYFMYGEDIDLSYRLIKKGYENWYLPLDILHYKGESTQKTSFRYVHVFYKAMLIFFRKYYGHLSFIFTLPISLSIFFKAILAFISIQCGHVRKQLGLLPIIREEAEYIFIGSKRMIDTCSHIAASHGLHYGYIEGNDCTLPRGHHEHPELINQGTRTYVIYDTSSYSYSHILKIMKENPEQKVLLGTYSNKSDIILTQEDIFF